MAEIIAAGAFDYGQLSGPDWKLVQDARDEINRLRHQARDDIIDIGRHLSEVKDRLRWGQWGAWLTAEFRWSTSTAENFMNCYELSKSTTVVELDTFMDMLAQRPSAAYAIAAPETPAEVRQGALEAHERGEKVTAQDVRAKGRRHKGEPPPAGTIDLSAKRRFEQGRAEAVDSLIKRLEAVAGKFGRGAVDVALERHYKPTKFGEIIKTIGDVSATLMQRPKPTLVSDAAQDGDREHVEPEPDRKPVTLSLGNEQTDEMWVPAAMLGPIADRLEELGEIGRVGVIKPSSVANLACQLRALAGPTQAADPIALMRQLVSALSHVDAGSWAQSVEPTARKAVLREICHLRDDLLILFKEELADQIVKDSKQKPQERQKPVVAPHSAEGPVAAVAASTELQSGNGVLLSAEEMRARFEAEFKRRSAAGQKQASAAAEMGIGYATVSRIINGHAEASPAIWHKFVLHEGERV